MGQNSSTVAVGTSKLAAEYGYIIVDASDSCVSGVKLRSTGIIPISELIKQEKCSKNIQKLEQSYIEKRKHTETTKPKDNVKNKRDHIETSIEDVHARRQWVPGDAETKKPFESDAAKIGLIPQSKDVVKEIEIFVEKKRNKDPPAKIHTYNLQVVEDRRKEKHTREKSTKKENDHVRKEAGHSSPRKAARKNVGIGTQDDIRPKIKKFSEQPKNTPIDRDNARNNIESSLQTITKDQATSYENIKQIYKRHDFDRKSTRRKCHDACTIKEEHKPKPPIIQPESPKHHKNKKEKLIKERHYEEKSTHQFQKHQISLPKSKPKNAGDHFKIETIVSCSIHPEKYFQSDTVSIENQLDRRAGQNYINRKKAGEYFNKSEKYLSCSKDATSLNSYELLPPSVSLLPSASTLEQAIKEQAIKEHRKYMSAKEALESWKNLHTWKQHRRRFEMARTEYQMNNLDVGTQTMSHSSIIGSVKSTHHLQPRPVQNDIIMPSEKLMYKDFMVKMEHCLQKHSRLCEMNAKRHSGEGAFTWVQDKHRRWHKIMFDDYKN